MSGTSSGRPLPRALPPMNNESEAQVPRRPRRKMRPNANTPNLDTVNPSVGVDGAESNTPIQSSPRRPLPNPETPGAGTENNGKTEPRRTRRRKRKPPPQEIEEVVAQNNISSILKEEDIVPVDKIEEAIVMTNIPGYTADGINSITNDKIYVQTTNGFAQHNRKWLDNQNKQSDALITQSLDFDFNKASYVANQFQQAFMYIALLLHGSFAGLAIWQVVVSYYFLSKGNQNFLVQYQQLSEPTQTVFYIILILCTVSVFDRFDFGAPEKSFFRGLITVDGMAWAGVFYFISLMISIGLAGLDYWIAMGYGIDTTLETSTSTLGPALVTTTVSPGTLLNVDSTLSTWKVLIIIRAVAASIGWLILAGNPKRNDLKFEDSK